VSKGGEKISKKAVSKAVRRRSNELDAVKLGNVQAVYLTTFLTVIMFHGLLNL
jgi:hypothetical protein